MDLRTVILEMSLKPFKATDEEYTRAVCRRMFRQWEPLARNADEVAVLLWTSDGSEILEYQGDLNQEMEWARYIGGANPRQYVPNDPEGKALHSRAYLYMENPPVLTYARLALIVRVLKEVGREVTGKPVRVGTTFDPGPEFARSPFKYERHEEVCLAGTMGRASFVCCYGVLNADTHRYAGFPEGIPQGTPVGTFLGRQARHFLTDLGFDYIWLSNGFGFGMETWATTGATFDGERFLPERAGEVREKLLDFWKRFRQECPGFPIETRGTNLTTGIDLASDAVPLQEIYAGGFDMAPPPNSPWAALNGDFGFELVGYMSHVAEVPADTFPFRYYVHDPWWLNSPWLDRYGREPHDIYLPLSVARVDAAGAVRNPSSISLLTVDDSYGEMPDRCPNEVIPHLQEAVAHAPDAPGPLVWVYPFAEYHAMALEQGRLEEPFFGDWFIRAAINNGLPLNTVVSSANFLASLRANPDTYRESVLLSIVPDAGSPLAGGLAEWVRAGGKALLYGPLAHAGEAVLDLLNLRAAAPLSGELDLDLRRHPDALAQGSYPTRLRHPELLSAGGIEAALRDEGDAGTEVAASVSDGSATRVAALCRSLPEWNGGAVAWMRGTNSATYHKGAHLLSPDDPAQWFHGDLLARFLLERLGVHVSVQKRRPAQRNPVTCIARHSNGFFFSGYAPDTTVSLRLRFPQGAPILVGLETWLEDGRSTYALPRAWRRECRVFVDGQDEGQISCVEQHSGEIGVRRRLFLRGLQNATVRFYPEAGTEASVRMLQNPAYP